MKRRITREMFSRMMRDAFLSKYTRDTSPAARNRIHTDRAPKGSPEEARRIEAARLKRLRKQAKRIGLVSLPTSDATTTVRL